jgi:hypothetical protein
LLTLAIVFFFITIFAAVFGFIAAGPTGLLAGVVFLGNHHRLTVDSAALQFANCNDGVALIATRAPGIQRIARHEG